MSFRTKVQQWSLLAGAIAFVILASALTQQAVNRNVGAIFVPPIDFLPDLVLYSAAIAAFLGFLLGKVRGRAEPNR